MIPIDQEINSNNKNQGRTILDSSRKIWNGNSFHADEAILQTVILGRQVLRSYPTIYLVSVSNHWLITENMKVIHVVLLIYAIHLISCDSSDDIPAQSDYLPLQVGNYWDFKSSNTSSDEIVEHREVVDEVRLNDLDYFLLVSTWSGHSNKDSVYYRIEPNGRVYKYRKNIFEENRFRLNATEGETWSYQVPVDDIAHITVRETTVTISKRKFRNCKEYYYDVEQWADEEYSITLAPGIGFVKEYSPAWGLGQVLHAAKINGRVITTSR